jgi:hypothetical protein
VVPVRAEVGVARSIPDDEGAFPPPDESPNGGEPVEPDSPFADLPAEWASLVIPDDPSSLAAEATAVRLELAHERRRHRRQRLLAAALPRYGTSTPLVGFLALVLTAFACLLVAVLPSGAPLQRAQPLAAPAVPPGRGGGLLPDVQLADRLGSTFPVRDVRPGVVLIVGDNCDCEGLIAEYTNATAEARVRLVVVGQDRAPLLPETGVRGRAVSATDPAGRLRSGLTQTLDPGPRAVLVRADGVIFRDVLDGRNVVTLRQDLAALT